MAAYTYRTRYDLGFRSGLPPTVKSLLVANTVIFFFQLLSALVTNLPISHIFGLVPYLVIQKLYFWQFFTYMFLHGGLMHLLFNMLVLWMLGGELETQVFGSRRFLIYYVICGVGAGVFNFLFSYKSVIPIIGASGAIYGILAAYAIYFGHRQMLVFPLPFPVEARTFVLILGGIELFSSIFYSQSGIAHLAHLGGLIVGYLYIVFWMKQPPKMGHWLKRLCRKRHLSIVVDSDGKEREVWH